MRGGGGGVEGIRGLILQSTTNYLQFYHNLKRVNFI